MCLKADIVKRIVELADDTATKEARKLLRRQVRVSNLTSICDGGRQKKNDSYVKTCSLMVLNIPVLSKQFDIKRDSGSQWRAR